MQRQASTKQVTTLGHRFFFFSVRDAPPPSLTLLIPVLSSALLATFVAAYWPDDLVLGGGAPMAGESVSL